MKYDFAIEQLENLKEVLKNSLEEWENSENKDNEIVKEMIRTYRNLIKETEKEIEVYVQAKATGFIMTRESRKLLEEIKQNKENDENER